MRAEAEVKSMLLMTVDESHRLDIEALPCKEAWKALQPANQANVLLRMVTDLLRERVADHKSHVELKFQLQDREGSFFFHVS